MGQASGKIALSSSDTDPPHPKRVKIDHPPPITRPLGPYGDEMVANPLGHVRVAAYDHDNVKLDVHFLDVLYHFILKGSVIDDTAHSRDFRGFLHSLVDEDSPERRLAYTAWP